MGTLGHAEAHADISGFFHCLCSSSFFIKKIFYDDIKILPKACLRP